jgi:hypothetical protein
MPKVPYHVDYQVVAAVYFEPEDVLSGPDFAHLWATTSIFGKQKVRTYFFHEDATEKARKPTTVQLGSQEFLQPLLQRDTRPIFGGADWGQPTGNDVDCDFLLVHSAAGVSWGYVTLPKFMMSVSGQWYGFAGHDVVLSKLKEQFQIVDRYAPRYGLIDVAASEDVYCGWVYSSIWPGAARLHRWTEDIKFRYACTKRKDYARGIFWGNYFGPAILERLGGRDQFVARYRESARDPNGNPNALIWEFTNGVFISLCLDPLGCKPGPPLDGNAAYNLHCLLLDLGPRGVLCPWSNSASGA